MKIVTVVGARPQFVKAAAVRRAIAAQIKASSRGRRGRSKKAVQEVLVHTGQHYDYGMDGVFFEELELPKPDHHLGVGSGSHAQQTALMLEGIEAVLQREKPDAVMVYGDTNSTLAGALTAAKSHIPVAHVEAGLRSFNRSMPEETNRLLTDHLSTLLFCPTRQSVQNLRSEGIKDGKGIRVKRVGDVMYDSILYYSQRAEERSSILQQLGLASSHGRSPSSARAPNYYLGTLHRAENTDDPKRLKSILRALKEIGKETPVVLPLHPRTRKMMKAVHLLKETRGIQWIDPVSYLDMLQLEKHAKAILTDSGGVQKEAYWLGVPCFTLREETEWVEIVHSGWNVLVGAETERIVEEVRRLSERKHPKKTGIFGDGRASEKIVRMLVAHFS
jgi:UDP-GlcNAc3NAcA epimerase